MLRKLSIASVALSVLFTFAYAGSAQADDTPTPDPKHMAGTPEANDGHDHGERLEANGAAVKITALQVGDVLDVPTVIVRVETTNWPLGDAGHHFHLYVNGQNQGMSPGNGPAIRARDLRPGENTLLFPLYSASET